MDAIECIFTRRSIREFEPNKSITKDDMNKILAAACSAPSAHNARPWEFIVIENKETIAALSEVKSYYKKPLTNASAAIAVIIEPNVIKKSKLGYKYQDCAAAMQNMLLAANALGLGSCWMGGFLETDLVEQVIKILKIPETKLFFGLASFGYAAEKKEPRGVVEIDKIHYEEY